MHLPEFNDGHDMRRSSSNSLTYFHFLDGLSLIRTVIARGGLFTGADMRSGGQGSDLSCFGFALGCLEFLLHRLRSVSAGRRTVSWRADFDTFSPTQ